MLKDTIICQIPTVHVCREIKVDDIYSLVVLCRIHRVQNISLQDYRQHCDGRKPDKTQAKPSTISLDFPTNMWKGS